MVFTDSEGRKVFAPYVTGSGALASLGQPCAHAAGSTCPCGASLSRWCFRCKRSRAEFFDNCALSKGEGDSSTEEASAAGTEAEEDGDDETATPPGAPPEGAVAPQAASENTLDGRLEDDVPSQGASAGGGDSDGGMAAPPPVPGQGGREPPPAGGGGRRRRRRRRRHPLRARASRHHLCLWCPRLSRMRASRKSRRAHRLSLTSGKRPGCHHRTPARPAATTSTAAKSSAWCLAASASPRGRSSVAPASCRWLRTPRAPAPFAGGRVAASRHPRTGITRGL